MRKLIEKPRAVAGMTVTGIDEDCRLYERHRCDYHLRLVEPAQPSRAEVQAFIANAYRRVFDAEVRVFYPSLVALHNSDDCLQGAAGARHADGQYLFLEQYLDVPVEQAIRLFAGSAVSRAKVVELGNLSVTRPALTYPFISLIGAWLQTYGIEWLVFALTRTLQKVFSRADVELLDLGAAEPSRLQRSANHWGSYYEHGPRVMAARLNPGLVNFQSHHPSRRRPQRRDSEQSAIICPG